MEPPVLVAHGLPSLPEPEERKETEPRAEALLTSKADTGQEQAPGPQGIVPFTSSATYQVCEPGDVFTPLCLSLLSIKWANNHT